MSKESVSLGAMLLGLALLGCSFWWANSTEPPAAWSDAEAQAYLDSGVKLHDMTFKVRRNAPTPKAGSPPSVTPEELAAQKKDFEEKQAVLDGARSSRKWTSWIMRGLGVVLIVGGLFGHKIGSG